MQSLTITELKAVLTAAADDTERLMFLVTFWHGLRVDEVCGITDPKTLKRHKLKATETLGMTGASIQFGVVDVKRLKGSKHTRQPFVHNDDPQLDESEPLRKLAKQVTPEQRLFPISRFRFYYVFQRAARKAGLPDFKQHPHCLKHSIAIYTIEKGIEVTRQWLGHESMSSTGEYLKISDDAAWSAVQSIGKGK